MTEYLCPYCKEWLDAEFCENHFLTSYNQPGVTFDRLKARMSVIGNLEVRDSSDAIDKSRVFETNNFQHFL
jgi:hypothetical protein